MQKTMEIEGKKVVFSTSLSWIYKYMSQFGEDPLGMVAPVLKTAVPIISEWNGNFTASELDQLTDILFDINVSDFLNIIWVLAKNGNKEISEPSEWYSEFDNFPVDEVIAEVAPDILRSCMSTKKYKALTEMMKKKKEKQAQKESLQEESEEDSPCETPNT